MPLVYRAVLSDSDGAITQVVEPLFLQWLKDKKLVGEEFRLAPGLSAPLSDAENPAWLQHHHAPGKRKGDDGLRRLRLVEESDEQRWITTITWRRRLPQQQMLDVAVGSRAEELSLTDDDDGGSAPESWVWIDLEHEPSGGRPLRRPGSPRIVRTLMAAGEAHDGMLPLTSEPFEITAQHVEELVGYLRDPRRRVPVAVFAHDARRAYDQAELATRLARDLAGVAAVFVLADGLATQALAEALPPDYAVYGGALRTYLPGVLADEDTPTRHRVLGRVSLAALGPRAFPALKDQVLQLSARRPPPVDSSAMRRAAPATGMPIAGHAPAASPAPAPVPAPPSQPKAATAVDPLSWFAGQIRRVRQTLGAGDLVPQLDALPVAQEALASAVDELIERLARTSTADASSSSTQQDQLAERLRTYEEDRQVLETLFSEASDEAKEAHRVLADLRDEHELLQLELAENLRSSDRLRRRNRWLAQLSTTSATEQVVEDFIEVPPFVAEVVALARKRLPHIVVGAVDQDAAELDVHAGASLYAAKTWDALLALDSYASARSSGAYSGGFRQWCLTPPDDAVAISAQAVAMNESETVENTPGLRAKRLFRVPHEVNVQGRQYMPAHVKLVKRGEAAPRLHFYDDSGGLTGKVYIGYVGRHLPTARFD